MLIAVQRDVFDAHPLRPLTPEQRPSLEMTIFTKVGWAGAGNNLFWKRSSSTVWVGAGLGLKTKSPFQQGRWAGQGRSTFCFHNIPDFKL